MEVQAARTRENNGAAWLDAYFRVSLAIEVGEASFKSREHVVDSATGVLPLIGLGIFEVQHNARSAGVEHVHDEVGVVGGSGHLVALIRAPGRQFDSPWLHGCDRRRQISRQFPCEGVVKGYVATVDKSALAKRQRGVQRR